MTGDLIPANVLATHTIANVSETLAEKLGLPRQYRSIGIITADSDDVTYCALDEATKAAAVEVVYGRSLYAGAGNASTKLAGEVIGILAGPNPAEVQSGLRACAEFMASGVGFRSANEDGSIVYFAHTVSRTGTYLSKTAGVREGEALAYLIAPPLEAVVGLDEALKASDVELAALFEPPSETNFGGGLLTGTQSACNAACAAFAEAVKAVGGRPPPPPAMQGRTVSARRQTRRGEPFGQGFAIHSRDKRAAPAGQAGTEDAGGYEPGAAGQNNGGHRRSRRGTRPAAGRHGGGGDGLRQKRG